MLTPLKHAQFRPLSSLSAFFFFLFPPLESVLRYPKVQTNKSGDSGGRISYLTNVMSCCNILPFFYMYKDICVRDMHTYMCVYMYTY